MAESTQFRFSNEHCKVSVDADTWGQVIVSKGHGRAPKFRVDVFYGPKKVTVAVNGTVLTTFARGEAIEGTSYSAVEAWEGDTGE